MKTKETEGRQPTILLVDDSPLNLGVIVGNLEEMGYHVLVAVDGEEALQRIDFTNPDLILLDVMLPGLDGFEVCRRLQAQPQTADIPVIFMTSLGGIQDKVKGFEAGAVDYITKPLQFDEVRGRIGTHLKLRMLQKTLAEKNRELQQEIVERKRMEEALTVREREFRSLAENLPDNIARWDAEGRILYSNPTHQRTLGKSASELIGKKQSEIFPDGRFSRGDDAVASVVASGKPELLRETVPDGNGAISIHDINFVPEFDDAGRVVSVLGLGRDMTDICRMQEAIAASERQFRSLADSSPGMMGAFYLRPDGSICMPYVSPNIQEIFGLLPGEVKDDASPLMARTHPDDAQRVAETIAESASNMTTWHEQYRILHPVRGVRWMESNTNPEPHPDGGVVWYGYVHDITGRKHMEEEIKLKEFALEQAQTAAYLINVEDMTLVYVNEAASRSLGYSRDELLSLSLPQIDPFLTPEEGMAILEQMSREGSATIESRHRRRDGSDFPVEIQITPLEYQGRNLNLSLVRDITERKQAERALEESRIQLRGLITQRETAREEERKLIARDVHDELGQILTGLKMKIAVIELLFAAESEALRDHVKEAMSLMENAIGTVRQISSSLRPVAMDMGIAAALEWQAGRFRTFANVPCKVHIGDIGAELDEHISVVIFRIVQESLTNIARHAAASKVAITLQQDAEGYVLKISDDGKGFEPGERKLNSFGLVGIRERALMLGGELAINSSPGNGTEIVVRIPARMTGFSISEKS